MPAIVTFDGASRIITEISTGGDNSLDAREIYSEWKEWVTLSDNAKFLPAFSVIGGEPTGPGQNAGSFFFLTNGWRLRPAELNHALTISGNLLVEGGVGSPIVNTLGAFNVPTFIERSNLVTTVATGGSSLTAAEIADAVWDELVDEHVTAGSFGEWARNRLLTVAKFLGLG